MKILVETRRGVAIELDRAEFLEFRHLISAIEGKTFDESYSFSAGREQGVVDTSYDFSSVFGAIRAFYEQKFRVNEIQKGLDMLKKSLGDSDA